MTILIDGDPPPTSAESLRFHPMLASPPIDGLEVHARISSRLFRRMESPHGRKNALDWSRLLEGARTRSVAPTHWTVSRLAIHMADPKPTPVVPVVVVVEPAAPAPLADIPPVPIDDEPRPRPLPAPSTHPVPTKKHAAAPATPPPGFFAAVRDWFVSDLSGRS